SDQSTAGDAELDSNAAVSVIVHVSHFALAGAELLHHHADKAFGHVDRELLHRFQQLSVNPFGYDLGLANHQLKSLATHHLQQNRKLEFASAHYLERIRVPAILHSYGHIGQQ